MDYVHVTKRVKRQEYGYLSIEQDLVKDNKTLKQGNTELQVSQIRYLPPKRKYTCRGEVNLPECFRGMVYTGEEEEVEFVNLPTEWVNENIQPGMIQLVKNMRLYGDQGFVRIPEGCNANAGTVEAFPGAPELRGK